MVALFIELLPLISILAAIFWLLMLYDCVRFTFRNRRFWLWVLFLSYVIGACFYCCCCWLPRHRSILPNSRMMKRWQLREALQQAISEVRHIGKAHQYVHLGSLLHEIGDLEQAAHAYEQALMQDPFLSKALWGLACVEHDCKNLARAATYLQALLKEKPDFAYGDATLAYGKILFELGEWDAAAVQLQNHIRDWNHPQSYLLLAKVQQKRGETAAARETLNVMITKINNSVPFQRRQNQSFVRQGERLLRVL